MKLLVTGGAGFIGSNFIRHILTSLPQVRVINLDRLTYAGNLENLAGLEEDARYTFRRGDIADSAAVEACLEEGVDAVVNFAAESHVDRSILDSQAFVRTNIEGTHLLLELCRRRRVGRFLQVSTDEVYGSLEERGRFSESSPLAPNSPYAASKAAGDLLVRAYSRTFGMDAIITRSSNNYGPYQFPEKLIPLMTIHALEGRPLPLYGDGLQTRDWIHVSDHCRALERILLEGRAGEVYNIGAGQERKNLEVVRQILRLLGRPESLIQFVRDRPAHDRRYAIDPGKLRSELGWVAEIDFEQGLEKTVRWYQENRAWIEHVVSGAYTGYYRRMYTERDRTLESLE